MGDIDKKLKALELEFLHGVPVTLSDPMIAQIRQVCGQVFYDRFEKELFDRFGFGEVTTGDDVQYEDALEIARKAAGME